MNYILVPRYMSFTLLNHLWIPHRNIGAFKSRIAVIPVELSVHSDRDPSVSSNP